MRHVPRGSWRHHMTGLEQYIHSFRNWNFSIWLRTTEVMRLWLFKLLEGVLVFNGQLLALSYVISSLWDYSVSPSQSGSGLLNLGLTPGPIIIRSENLWYNIVKFFVKFALFKCNFLNDVCTESNSSCTQEKAEDLRILKMSLFVPIGAIKPELSAFKHKRALYLWSGIS